MTTTPAQVFGPGRPNAARAAIAELAQARDEVERTCSGFSDYDSPAARARLARAVEVRAMYPEYGQWSDLNSAQWLASTVGKVGE